MHQQIRRSFVELRFLCPTTTTYARVSAEISPQEKKLAAYRVQRISSELTFHAPDRAAGSSALSPLRSSQISVSAINTRVLSSLINFTSSQLRERRSSNSSDQCNSRSYLLEFLKKEKQRTARSVCNGISVEFTRTKLQTFVGGDQKGEQVAVEVEVTKRRRTVVSFQTVVVRSLSISYHAVFTRRESATNFKRIGLQKRY